MATLLAIFLEYLKGIPSELATMIIGMTPVFELRGAIPVAIAGYKMSLWEAYFWAVLGNIIPAVLLVFLLDKVSSFLMKRYFFWNRFFNWLFDRTRRKAEKQMKKYGAWGVYVLVAIPLPMTGGWTGAMAAFLFGIEKKKAAMIITLGIMTAGIIVLFLTTIGTSIL